MSQQPSHFHHPVTNYITAEPEGALFEFKAAATILNWCTTQIAIINQIYPRKNIAGANFLEKYDIYEEVILLLHLVKCLSISSNAVIIQNYTHIWDISYKYI